jgi:hypothetical protein
MGGLRIKTDILGADAEGQLKHWIDRRGSARAKAKEQTEAARKGAVAALARKSRADARARHAKRYTGVPCERHDNAERYTANGQCVFCDVERTSARRGKPRSFGPLRQGRAWRHHMRHVPKAPGAVFPSDL